MWWTRTSRLAIKKSLFLPATKRAVPTYSRTRSAYRGTSLVRKRLPPETYSRPMPTVLRHSLGGGGGGLSSEVPLCRHPNEKCVQGYLAHKKTLTPLGPDPHGILGIDLRCGPGRVRFLMSEVPLYLHPNVPIRSAKSLSRFCPDPLCRGA